MQALITPFRTLVGIAQASQESMANKRLLCESVCQYKVNQYHSRWFDNHPSFEKVTQERTQKYYFHSPSPLHKLQENGCLRWSLTYYLMEIRKVLSCYPSTFSFVACGALLQKGQHSNESNQPRGKLNTMTVNMLSEQGKQHQRPFMWQSDYHHKMQQVC